MVIDHEGNLSSSWKSVVVLSTLLFDTYFLSEMSLLIEKLSQCRRHHRIQLIIIWEICSFQSRSWCDEIVNWLRCFNFFDPLHSETRILCFWAYFCSEAYFPALEFHRVWELAKVHFQYLISRIIHHTMLWTSPKFTGMVLNSSHQSMVISTLVTLTSCSPVKAWYWYRRHGLLTHLFFFLHKSFLSVPFLSFSIIMPNLSNFRRTLKDVLLEQVSLQNRFLEYPYHFVYHGAVQKRGSAFSWNSKS